MSNTLLLGQDKNLSQAALGVNADVAMNSRINISSNTWRDPPLSSIGNIWPSESTWHPLYEYDKLEVMEDLLGKDASQVEKVGAVIKQVPQMKGIKMLTTCIILCIIILIVALVVKSPMAYYVLAGMGVLTVLVAIYTFFIAPSAGESDWMALIQEYQGQRAAGSTDRDILEKYGKERELNKQLAAERERAQLQANAMARYNRPSFGSSLAAGAIGGYLTSR